MNKLLDNPWGLSPAEAEAFDAMCQVGSYKLAERLTGKDANVIEQHIYNGTKKMGTPPGDKLLKYLLWDRFRRAQTPENAMHLIGPNGTAPVSAETVERAFS